MGSDEIGSEDCSEESAADNEGNSGKAEILDLLISWKISARAIQRLFDCGIITSHHLGALSDDGVKRIFQGDFFIGDSELFSLYLKKWRKVSIEVMLCFFFIAPLAKRVFFYKQI